MAVITERKDRQRKTEEEVEK